MVQHIIIRRVILLNVLLLISFQKIQAQSSPKVGLCLSGGGAKGLAHIGILKVIDSLGIKIDYITGTSMGAIVGGLYASGYSGKQIDSIAKTAQWDILLSQTSPLSTIRIDEKSESSKYIGDVPIDKNGNINYPGIIEGQELLAFLQKLTFHVSLIHDFSKLPIPFKCLAVDIVKVKPYVLDHGSLALAIRASMSIPVVFKPIIIDGKLLVDGGLMNNFPVQEVKDMGAEIIIGSYTGGRTYEAKELKTIMKLMTQTSLFYSIQEGQDDIKLCTIFNNLNENPKMRALSSSDFKKFKQILAVGEEIPTSVIEQLKEIAKQQQSSNTTHSLQSASLLTRKNILASIAFDTILNKSLKKHIIQQIPFKTGDSISYQDISKVVSRLYGSGNFFKTYYELTSMENEKVKLDIGLEEDTRFHVRGAIHYDSELGTGLILNATARNFIGKVSRLSLTGDIAETPKLRLNYQKYIFDMKNTFLSTEFYAENNTQNVYAENLQKKNILVISNSTYNAVTLSMNYKFTFNSLATLTLQNENYSTKPKFSQSDLFSGIENSQYSSSTHTLSVKATILHNTLDNANFPTRGVDLEAGMKLVFFSREKQYLSGYNTVQTIDSAKNTIEKIDTIRINFSNYYLPYLKVNFKLNNYTPINSKLSLVTGIALGANFNNIFDLKNSANIGIYTMNDDQPLADAFYIGSVDKRPRTADVVPFWGLNEGGIVNNNFVASYLGFQYTPIKSFYISPRVSFLNYSNTNKYLLDNLSNDSELGSKTLWSVGVNLGYKTPLGPVAINLSKVSTSQPVLIYFSFGYRF